MKVEEELKISTPPQGDVVTPSRPERHSSKKGVSLVGLGVVVLLATAVLAFFIFSGISERAKASTALRHDTLQNSILTVAVTRPVRTAAAEEVILPGSMQSFIDTPIWARSSGYLKKWYVDIGGHVKAGQLLAVIESPEVDKQLDQAKASQETAQANYTYAASTAVRYQNLLKTDSVAKQETDQMVSAAAAQKATLDAMTQNVKRLEQMQSFERVYAPFDGIITARNVDVGALIDAGANTPGKELFHEGQINTLRIYVSIPEMYSRAAQKGVHAYLTLDEYPDRKFMGTVVRNANSIDATSRTLLVEVDVKNPTGELLPGSYVSVHLNIQSKAAGFVVPSNALIFQSAGLQVAVVRNNRAQLIPVSIGHDYGNTVEVVSGLKADDQVIVNPSDSLTNGEPVRVTQHQGRGE
jgi:RND family efflux transporter MFP subunit